MICGNNQKSYCNSHSIPQFSLKQLSKNGQLITSLSLVKKEMPNLRKGIKNAGVFHTICNSCDQNFFKDYENIEKIKKKPTDIMLGEIAVKNILLQISKRLIEANLYSKQLKKVSSSIVLDEKASISRLDLRDYLIELEFQKDIVLNNKTNGYNILFWDILPYKIPIACQTGLALEHDYEGFPINHIYNFSPDINMQYMHIIVLPLEETSIVLAFYHKKDKAYSQLRHQLNSITKENALKYINYLIISESENFYLSPDLDDKILNDQKLISLTSENRGHPNFGQATITELINYTRINMNEIPNFLSSEFAI
ncbi:hypothetical protein J0J35_05390 [Lactococcus sp. LG606]|nr:hypothetical protein J0J35_05390 [Lactococcus sp. LG606]